MPKSTTKIISGKIRVLGDYQLHRLIVRRIVKKPEYVKPPQFEKELIAYERNVKSMIIH